MKRKTLIAIIVILAILTSINTIAIFAMDNILNRPQAAYSVEILGTVFKEDISDTDVIEIDLIRPPRTVVIPGETTYPESTAINTADFDIYLRAAYRVEVRNEEGIIVNGFDDKVNIVVNDGWEYTDNYWHYSKPLSPGERVPGLVQSIEYSETFKDFLAYEIYIPVLVEALEATGTKDDKYWSNKHINNINPEDYINDNMSWTQKAEIIIQ